MRRFARTSFCVGRPTGSGVTLRPKVLVLLARDASRSSHGFRLDLLRRWRRGWDYPASRALRVWCSALLRLHSRAGSRTAFFIPQRNLDFSLRSKLAERVGFEPTERFRSAVFKTAAIDHSATSPQGLQKSTGSAPTRETFHFSLTGSSPAFASVAT